jgi:hypothetical protein
MSLILGILDSGGAAAGGGTSYESIATATPSGTSTVTFSFVSIKVTERSSISDKIEISFVRGSNLRILSSPVIITCPLSIEVTRVIGTKIFLRGGTSTIKPKILGG